MATGQLFHRSWGEPRPRGLLMVHPLGADSAFWDEAAALLSNDHYCIACDLRSAGRSPVAGRPLSLESHAGDLDALARASGLRSLVAIGCAVGSMIAAGFAARTELPVEALVLSNPATRFSATAREMIGRRVDIARRDGLAGLSEEVVARAFEGMPQDRRRAAFADMFRRQSVQGYVDLAEGIRDADIAGDLGRLQCPILLLTSRHDVLLPPALAEEVRRIVPQAELRHIEEGAHFIPYQAPAAFAEAVRGFLATIEGDAS